MTFSLGEVAAEPVALIEVVTFSGRAIGRTTEVGITGQSWLMPPSAMISVPTM
jgi:hypothetical protein